MSVAMVSMVLDCFPSGASLRCLAIALADAADDDGGSIFKSVATLAHQSVLSERTVQRALADLVEHGWLEVVESAHGRGRPTVYRIAPHWVTGCAVERARARVAGCKPDRVELSTKGDKLTPIPPTQKGDKKPEKGDKNEQKGDTHGCHPNKNKERINPPYPPLTRGAVDKSIGANSQKAGQPEQPNSPTAAEQQSPSTPPGGPMADGVGAPVGVEPPGQGLAGARPPWRWRESRAGVEAMAALLGMGSWDEQAFGVGQGEQWPAYAARVERAYTERDEAERAALQAGAGKGRRAAARAAAAAGRPSHRPMLSLANVAGCVVRRVGVAA